MFRWEDSDVDFFVPQLAAVLMSKGVPSRNVHVSCGKGGWGGEGLPETPCLACGPMGRFWVFLMGSSLRLHL